MTQLPLKPPIMAATMNNSSNLSRLNRYFDPQRLPPSTGGPSPSYSQTIRPHGPHIKTISPQRSSSPPSAPSTCQVCPPANSNGISNGNTIDGAACKTSTWTYKHVSAKTGGVAIIEKGARVRADKRARRPLQKLNWKNGPWPKNFSPSRDYLDLDTRTPSIPVSSDVSPRLAVKRVTLLASHQQYKDAASFIHRLPSITVRSALSDLPMTTLVEAMPLSLPVIEALYCTAGEVSPELLHIDRVVWQMVRFFAQQEECLTGDIRWEFCGPFVNLCRDVLRVVARIQPMLRRTLLHRRRKLEKAIEGMGHHGLVGTSDESLTALHDALKLEFEKVVKSYTSALGTLNDLGNGNKGHVSKGPAPIQASHQRQLSIAVSDIQERLIKNKSLLNIVEPTLGNHSLDILLGILQRRIEHDKDSLFQFTQLRKEAKDIDSDAVVAPILMRYAHGCDQVLEMLREVMEESGCDVMADDDDSSDVSGYHSDSDSAIMMSGNSPYVTKHARFNFLTRSIRDRSRVGTRMSLPISASGASSSSPASSGVSCSSSAVGSDTQSHGGSSEGEGANKAGSPAPSNGHSEDTGSVLKAPSEVASASTLAGIEAVASRSELEALRSELTQARQTIRLMHEREKEMKERLSDRSNHLSPDRRSCLRVTSPGRSAASYGNQTNNCMNINKGTKYTNPSLENTKCSTNNLINNTKCENKCPDRIHGGVRREFVRSKSIVSLVDESPGKSSQGSTNKNWSQTYSKEYPKGYLSTEFSHNTYKKDTNNYTSNMAKNNMKDGNSCVTNCHTDHNCDKKQLHQQQQQQLKRSSAAVVASLNSRLENLSLGDRRPSQLVRRYGNLYAQARLETLDALEELTEMRSATELKSKLVFSVVVLAFRSVSATATALRQDVRRILQVRPANKPGEGVSSSSVASHYQSTIPIYQGGSCSHLAQTIAGLTKGTSPDVTALEAAMATVITANVDSHDLTRNVEDVCQQIWATLYDYPGLKDCEGLLRYIKECVRVAWGLVNQTPPYCIEYEARTFRNDLHVRFHTSDSTTEAVRTYLWPALTEGVDGTCVHKGVVLT